MGFKMDLDLDIRLVILTSGDVLVGEFVGGERSPIVRLTNVRYVKNTQYLNLPDVAGVHYDAQQLDLRPEPDQTIPWWSVRRVLDCDVAKWAPILNPPKE